MPDQGVNKPCRECQRLLGGHIFCRSISYHRRCARCLPARQRARRPGSLRYNCVLCSIRRLHYHPDSSAVPGGRAIPHCAAIGAPTGRHPARQPRRSVCTSPVGTGEGGAARWGTTG